MEYGITCEKCLAKEKASGPLDAATCSPSLNPETDANAECEQEDGSPFAPVREWVHADFARRLERERDTNRRLYETECKDHAFMRKTLERVIAERDKIHVALVKLDGVMRHEMGNHGFRPDWLRDAISLENAKPIHGEKDA